MEQVELKISLDGFREEQFNAIRDAIKKDASQENGLINRAINVVISEEVIRQEDEGN